MSVEILHSIMMVDLDPVNFFCVDLGFFCTCCGGVFADFSSLKSFLHIPRAATGKKHGNCRPAVSCTSCPAWIWRVRPASMRAVFDKLVWLPTTLARAFDAL